MTQDQAKMKETDAHQDDKPDVNAARPPVQGLPSGETFMKAIAQVNEWLKEACGDRVQVYGVAAHLRNHGPPDNLVHVPVQIRCGPAVYSFIIEWHAEEWEMQPLDHDELASVLYGNVQEFLAVLDNPMKVWEEHRIAEHMRQLEENRNLALLRRVCYSLLRPCMFWSD